MKAIIIILIDIRGIIMIECVPEPEIVNQKYYLEVLTKVQGWMRKKGLELWKKKSWIVHEGNAPTHSALNMKQHLANNCIPVLECPPPPFTRLSPLWLFPLPQSKSELKGSHFHSFFEVK